MVDLLAGCFTRSAGLPMLDAPSNPTTGGDSGDLGRLVEPTMTQTVPAPDSAAPASPSITAEQMLEFHALALEAKATDEVAQELSAALGMAHQIRVRGC